MSERTHYIYEAYDAAGVLLYIGCTGNLEVRLRDHLRPSYDARGWFGPFVCRWRVSGPYVKATALRIESERIGERQPVWNGQSNHNRNNGRALINAYLKKHRVKFVPHPRRANSALLVTLTGRPVLRVIA